MDSVVELYLGNRGIFAVEKKGAGLCKIEAGHPLYQRATLLKEQCNAAYQQDKLPEFRMEDEQGTYWRVSLLESTLESVYVLRRFPDKAPSLADLHLHRGHVRRLMAPDLRGLVLITGSFRNGKTTTASAVIRDRLDAFPSVAVCIEDPPELPLEGEYAKGICYQTWARSGRFADGIKAAARWAPDIIFLGEIRDGDAALEAIKAAINGALVIATMHASGPQEALTRLHALAAQADGTSASSVSHLMAGGLRGVFWQRLIGEEGKDKRLSMQMLWFEDDDHALRQKVAEREWRMLQGEINIQQSRLITEMERG
jgi:twitching motility protein PilT